MMRKFSSMIVAVACLFAQTGCGIVAHQAKRATHLLLSPVRAAGNALQVEVDREGGEGLASAREERSSAGPS